MSTLATHECDLSAIVPNWFRHKTFTAPRPVGKSCSITRRRLQVIHFLHELPSVARGMWSCHKTRRKLAASEKITTNGQQQNCNHSESRGLTWWRALQPLCLTTIINFIGSKPKMTTHHESALKVRQSCPNHIQPKSIISQFTFSLHLTLD